MLAGALLKAAESLLDKGIHPNIISEGKKILKIRFPKGIRFFAKCNKIKAFDPRIDLEPIDFNRMCEHFFEFKSCLIKL